jgi:hypothetical protein
MAGWDDTTQVADGPGDFRIHVGAGPGDFRIHVGPLYDVAGRIDVDRHPYLH